MSFTEAVLNAAGAVIGILDPVTDRLPRLQEPVLTIEAPSEKSSAEWREELEELVDIISEFPTAVEMMLKNKEDINKAIENPEISDQPEEPEEPDKKSTDELQNEWQEKNGGHM